MKHLATILALGAGLGLLSGCDLLFKRKAAQREPEAEAVANERSEATDLTMTKTATPPAPTYDVQMAVLADQPTKQISPYIYGSQIFSTTSWDGATRNLTFGRIGGNAFTGYNWSNNATNNGADWYNTNDNKGGGSVTGAGVGLRIELAHAAKATTLVTVPMTDYVAADSIGDHDITQSPNYKTSRLRANHPAKDGAFTLIPDPANPNVYQDEFINWIATNYTASSVFFALDNEPDIWDKVHPAQRDSKLTYEEIKKRSVATATAVRNVAPNAVIFGPSLCCYYGYQTLSGAADAGDRFFIDYYLQQMQQAGAASGKRLLDVLDLHWYPEHTGANGVPISGDDAAPATAAARIEAPRSLWDPTFKENSWISRDVLNGPVALIPTMQAKIAANYPGTKLAFSEYYYGGGGDISGALAEAEVLGIFATSEVYAANIWHLGSSDDRFIYGAFSAFRNYDGSQSTFGDQAIATKISDAVAFSIYASIDSSTGKRVLIVINKRPAAQTASITISGGSKVSSAKTFVLAGTNPNPVPGATLTATANALVYTMPALSVTTLELN